MKKIIFPLKPETKGSEIADLHAALQLLLDRELFLGNADDTGDDLVKPFRLEHGIQNYGTATEKLVAQFQKARNLEVKEKGRVDEATADAINDLLAKLGQLDTDSKTAADPVYKVLCNVVDGKGKPIAGLKVLAFDQDPNRIHDRLGEPAITTAEGYAEFRFKRSDFTEHPGEGNPDLFFQIYRGNTLLSYTLPDIH